MRRSKPANWSRKLARVIVLEDGTRLRTLSDAPTVVLDVFGSVNARSGVLDASITRLMQAATSGHRDDIAAATDSLERVLRDRRLL